MKYLTTLFACLMLASCAQANSPESAKTTSTSPASAASTVASALADSGMKISGELDAPKGYFGFVGNYQGRQIPVYLMPDGKHIAIGTLIDTQGHDLTSPAMRKAADSRYSEADWQALGKADWIAEGNLKAKRIVYVFVDTRCPFCEHFWKLSQPYLKRGNVQVRNILVAVISPQSLPEAALILDAKDPAKAWQKNEANYGHNPAPAAKAGSNTARQKLQANNKLMNKLGFFGTPAVVYKDANGKIHAANGVPQDPQVLRDIFGE